MLSSPPSPFTPHPTSDAALQGAVRGECKKSTARLTVQQSDAEVFLWLMNGTFEVSSLARSPKPASPVVGVNWPVVCLPGTMPSSLPANLVRVATPNGTTITSTSKPSINFPHTIMYPFTVCQNCFLTRLMPGLIVLIPALCHLTQY